MHTTGFHLVTFLASFERDLSRACVCMLAMARTRVRVCIGKEDERERLLIDRPLT